MDFGKPYAAAIERLAARVMKRLEAREPLDAEQVQEMLEDVIRRLDEDHQVLHIWQLYKTVNQEFTRPRQPANVAPSGAAKKESAQTETAQKQE